ncbi:MAG TPA: zinc ribbon domain-containing protein [Candidatus Binataceae bacterium]|nr:zinc ribbon domain-containing protein [Candidatus Binataceae bacterium]
MNPRIEVRMIPEGRVGDGVMAQAASKPVPAPDELSKPFWEAARERRLVIQRCAACGYYNHPPRPICESCSSERLEFHPVSGRATIHTFIVMRQPNNAGFETDIPYVNIVVELDEQPMLFVAGNLPFSELDRIHIGGRAEVWFEDRGADLVVPQFRPL